MTMTQYPKELKSAITSKMLPPLNQSVRELEKETGIPHNTLYTWRAKARKQNGIMTNSTSTSPEEKLNIIIETAHLSQSELSIYCRDKGLFPEDIAQWKTDSLAGFKTASQQKKEQHKADRELMIENKKLKKELRRKEKALAETAALLVLRKKLNAFYEREEED